MASTFHGSHSFKLVNTSAPVTASKVTEKEVETVVHLATCDLCNKGPIVGTRWKCTSPSTLLTSLADHRSLRSELSRL